MRQIGSSSCVASSILCPSVVMFWESLMVTPRLYLYLYIYLYIFRYIYIYIYNLHIQNLNQRHPERALITCDPAWESPIVITCTEQRLPFACLTLEVFVLFSCCCLFYCSVPELQEVGSSILCVSKMWIHTTLYKTCSHFCTIALIFVMDDLRNRTSMA